MKDRRNYRNYFRKYFNDHKIERHFANRKYYYTHKHLWQRNENTLGSLKTYIIFKMPNNKFQNTIHREAEKIRNYKSKKSK